MESTIPLRQDGEPSDSNTQFESADNAGGQDVCALYLANAVADRFGQFITATISDEAEVAAELVKSTKNYGVYETPGGAVTGFYVAHDRLAEIVDADEVDEGSLPETIGLAFADSDEDTFDATVPDPEEEADALTADASDTDDEDDTDDENEVEVADEEVGLIDG